MRVIRNPSRRTRVVKLSRNWLLRVLSAAHFYLWPWWGPASLWERLAAGKTAVALLANTVAPGSRPF
jgi:hypothetical protein